MPDVTVPAVVEYKQIMNQHEEALKKRLAAISKTQSKDWFLVSRARHGMAEVLAVLARQKGRGQVVTQAFTCITAVNPILEAGHTPVYGGRYR